ncbi:MAG: aminoglycoside phosphotransferase family protein [Pseudomonadota bacterium]
MKTLEKNAINVWGEPGKLWLNQLADIIAQLSDHWNLSNIEAVTNMSYNYVAKSLRKNNTPVVLKFSCDKELIANEYRTLKHFKGQGSIKVFDIHRGLNALLLEQAIPGDLLKNHHLNNIKGTIKIYATVIKALASGPNSAKEYLHVKKWCEAIDRIADHRIKAIFINKAKMLRNFLFQTKPKEYLCHADLHLENIISHGNKWLSIDLKGVIGEMASEAAAFDLIGKNEWSESETIKNKIITRVKLLANELTIDKNRLLAWIFLRIIISAQWFIEDNGDPTEMLNLAANVYPLLD